jgi:hypothetical protein
VSELARSEAIVAPASQVPFGGPTVWLAWKGTLVLVCVFALALLIGLLTARDHGISIDEFNADDYGPKSLAWYTERISRQIEL